MTRLAIFDLDYTLTEKGTWGRFVLRAIKDRPWIFLPLGLDAGLSQLAYKVGLIPRVRVKQRMMAWAFRNWSRERIMSLARSFADDEVASGLNTRVVEALRAHQANGDIVLIASAAVDAIVRPIASALDVQHYVATDFAWTGDGSLAPHFATPNCYAAEKAKRVFEWKARVLGRMDVFHITVYSDSASDAPIFDLADRAVVVRPGRRARRYAEKNGFEIWS